MSHLSEHVESYLAANTRIRSPHTRDHYRRAVRQFSEYLEHEATSEDLTDELVAVWLNDAIAQGLCERTANSRGKCLLALWRWLAKKRVVDQFPTVNRIREPELLPDTWSDAEIAKLFTACASEKGWVGPHLASDWWLSLHCTIYDTGERIGCVLQWRRSMVNIEAGTASIPAAIRKGGQKSMVYRLTQRTCEILARMARVPSDTGLIWDRPFRDDQSLYNRYRKVVKRAGLPWVSRKTGFHKLRRTVYTKIEEEGGDATRLSGHTTRRVLEDHYLDRARLLDRRAVWPPKVGIFQKLVDLFRG
jgi:integrase